MTKATHGPRERLLDSAIALVRERGVEGTGLSDLLAHSNTARGSIYQHFPRGKDELIENSTRLAGELFRGGIAAVVENSPTPAAVLDVMVDHSQRILQRSDFAQGCPIVAATASGNRDIQAAAGEAFAGWRAELADLFVSLGQARDSAESLASFTVSALEGAIVQARAGRTLQPLEDVRRHLSAVFPSTSEETA